MFGFGKEKFQAPKPAAVEKETGNTDPAAVEALEERIRTIVTNLPGADALASDLNISMTANFLRKQREQAGNPYTEEEINALGDDFNEQVRSAFMARAGAQGATTGYRVVNKDGFVVGAPGSVVEAGEIAAHEHEHEDRA